MTRSAAASHAGDTNFKRAGGAESTNAGRRSVISTEVGTLLGALRRVQAPINKDGANIAFIQGDAATARIVATSGPHLSCSTPLGMALSESIVVRGNRMLKSLATYPLDTLDSQALLGVATNDAGEPVFCDLQIKSKASNYRGSFALVPDAMEMNVEAINRERQCRQEGQMVVVQQQGFLAAMRRALLCAKAKTNSANYTNLFFESDGERLWVVGVANTCASRYCVSESPVPVGTWSIHMGQADILMQGLGDQIVNEDATIEMAFSPTQILVTIGHVTYALRTTSGRLPNLERILARFEPEWSVTLNKADVKHLLTAMPILTGDDVGKQGVRFRSEGEGVMLVPEGRGAMEAQVPLDESTMVGSMPGGIMLVSDILGVPMRADLEFTSIRFEGSTRVPHIHVETEGMQGLMVIMPTNI